MLPFPLTRDIYYRLGRWSAAALLAAVLFFAGMVLVLRFWLLPNINQYRNTITVAISQAVGYRVTVGRVSANWVGLRPQLVLWQVALFNRRQQPMLALHRVEAVVSWWSLFFSTVQLHSLTIDSPVLTVRRRRDGIIDVAGIPVNRSGGSRGFAGWLLRQHHLLILNARVQWRDDLRRAPPLEFNKVNFRLDNHGNRHRFGLTAIPPASLASPLDIRGDVRGATTGTSAGWHGELYVRLNRVNLGAWRAWLTFPFVLSHGSGGVQLWYVFGSGRPLKVTADVRLNAVQTRLDGSLPVLSLTRLQGWLKWQRLGNGFTFSVKQLSLATPTGITLAPADVLVRYSPATQSSPGRGEIQLKQVALTPLRKISAYLPLPSLLRQKLATIVPQGMFNHLIVHWRGAWDSPQQYQVNGRFTDLGMKPYGKLPGFEGVSGNVTADETGGSLSLISHKGQLTFLHVLRAPLHLNALAVQADWTVHDRQVDVNLTNASFANTNFAGNAFGSYRFVHGTPGVIDLTARLFRVDLRAVSHYVPLSVSLDARRWLDQAFLAGTSTNTRLRLKGNLAEFPFVNDRNGIFRVAANIREATLHYATGWPKIDHITGDLLFHGGRMDVNISHGDVFGMQLKPVHAVIPDLETPGKEVLNVTGVATGPTAGMLRFINRSPLAKKVGDVTERMRSRGKGRLTLTLNMPLNHVDDTHVSGGYQFIDNRIDGSSGAPVLNQVNGTLHFNEASVTANNLSAFILGGPASIKIASQTGGGAQINVRGRLSAINLRQASANPLFNALTGAADWRARILLDRRRTDVTLDSSLVGLRSNLPAPFAKKKWVALPFHLEKHGIGAGQDIVTAALGRRLTAIFLSRNVNGRTIIDRGTVNFGKTAVLPKQPGVWLKGHLAILDIDRWRALWARMPDNSGLAAKLAGANLDLGQVTLFNRRFPALQVRARAMDGSRWQIVLRGPDANGIVNWQPQGNGKLVARLKYFFLPPAEPMLQALPEQTAAQETRTFPALDIIVDKLRINRRALGKLVLAAAYNHKVLPTTTDDDWRINRLSLSNTDFIFNAHGQWLNWLSTPQTQLTLTLAIKNIGRFLGRFGYPGMVSRGTARLSGNVTWAGNPQHINYSTMSGKLALTADNGQFLKVDPGIGKLIGIISLQALPRRITLDFRDVFSEGFAFSHISSTLQLRHGVLASDDFTMRGPAALVNISGKTNLAKENQVLTVRVTPLLGESVSMAGALLGGPVVGITSLLLQRILKDPIGHLVSYEYMISGTWDNPQVRKLKKAPFTGLFGN